MKGTSLRIDSRFGYSDETKEGGYYQYHFSLLADLNSTPIVVS